jgi:hypothetical protein
VIQASWKGGGPVAWERVHKTPDYVFFNHAVHVRRGIGCESCHGKVNEMPVVVHEEPLSMGWCLECHRHPERHLRPAQQATAMGWRPPEGRSQSEFGRYLKDLYHTSAPESCTGCHR